jgi:hypothetical protein
MVTLYLCGIVGDASRCIDRHAPRAFRGRPETGGSGPGYILGLIDTLQTLPVLRLPDPRRDVVPGRRFHRHDRGRASTRSRRPFDTPRIGIREGTDPQAARGRPDGNGLHCRGRLLTRVRLQAGDARSYCWGFNQTIMLALVDAGDHRACRHPGPGPGGLYRADQGRHAASGHRRRPLGGSFIAIVADRLISAGASHARRRLGLE